MRAGGVFIIAGGVFKLGPVIDSVCFRNPGNHPVKRGGVLVSSLVLLRPVVFFPSHQQPNDGVAGGQFAL